LNLGDSFVQFLVFYVFAVAKAMPQKFSIFLVLAHYHSSNAGRARPFFHLFTGHDNTIEPLLAMGCSPHAESHSPRGVARAVWMRA
jgi:hypothetical protein